MGTNLRRVKSIGEDTINGLELIADQTGLSFSKLRVASHSYASGTTAWTASKYEDRCNVLCMTLAGGAANAIFTPRAGALKIVVNSSGATITVKPTAASGVAVLDGTVVILMGNVAGTDFITVTTTTGAISGSTINNSVIGGVTPAAAHFTTLDVTGTTALSPTGSVTINPSTTLGIAPTGAMTMAPTAASTINNASIGATTPLAGTFTTLGYGVPLAATHDYGAVHTAWTLSAAEGRARVFTTTNADTTATTAVLPAGFVGVFFVYNTSTSQVTWKYTSSTGVANANTKRAILVGDGAEVYALKADY